MPALRLAWRSRALGPILAAALVLGMAPGLAWGQFSPGPLSRVHAPLEGATKCLNCHGLTNSVDMPERCLICHRGVARLISEGRGLHGRPGRPACLSCHAEHRGIDGNLIDRSDLFAGKFDHGKVGWPLNGKHLAQKCQACHKRELQSSDLLSLEPKPEVAHAWIGLPTDCAACHQDPHGGRLGTRCAECHQETGFHDVARDRFAHDRTRFPLLGAHGKVACAKCHDTASAWGATPKFTTCGGCHADPHAGQATLAGQPADCGACHNEEGFTLSTFSRARHDTSPFPLEGKHEAVPCIKCHPKKPKGDPSASLGTAGILLRRPHGRCDDCHADAHGSQFATRADRGECRACHTVTGWQPSVFGLKEHQGLIFTLEGAHGKAPCKACHGPDRPGAVSASDVKAPGTAGLAFKFGRTTCLTCHVDPHDGRYSGAVPDVGQRACPACHNVERFRPSTVDVQNHADFGYALEGAHRAIGCDECHRSLAREPLHSSLISAHAEKPRLVFEQKHQDCIDCHTDFHEGQLRGPCSRCHVPDSFRPATKFEHDRDASFSLKGAHSKVPCARCHPEHTDASGTRHVTFRPLPVGCNGCHVDSPTSTEPNPTNPTPKTPTVGSTP